MAMQNIIDVSWDLEKFDIQTKSVLAYMDEVLAKGTLISKQNISPGSGGGYTEIISKTKEFEKIQQEQEKTRQQVIKTQTAQLALEQKIAAEKERTAKIAKSKKTPEQESAEAEKAANREYNSLKALTDERKLLSQAIRDNEIRYSNLFLTGNGNTKQAKEILEQTIAQKTQYDQLQTAMGNYQQRVGDYGGKFYNAALTLRGLRGPVKLLGEAMGVGAQQADQFRLVIEHSFQALSAFFRHKESKAAAEAQDAAATAASTAAEEANTTATATGNTVTREAIVVRESTVGVTEAATVAETELTVATVATTTATSALMTVLKFSGIALILTAIGYLAYKIYEVAKASGHASEAQKALAENMKNANEIYTEADKNAGKEVEDLKLIYNGTQDVTLGVKERTKAAKYLQETYPDTFKNFTTEEILLGNAKAGYDLLTAAILKNALAKAAVKKLEDISTQILDAETSKQNIKNATDRETAEAGKVQTSTNAGGIGQNRVKFKQDALNRIKDRREAALLEQDDRIKSLKDQQDFIIKFVGQSNLIDEIIGGKKDKSGKENLKSSSSDSLKERLDLEYELYKIAQQRRIQLLTEQVADQKTSIGTRLLLEETLSKATIDLNDRTAKHEIEAQKSKLDALQKNLRESDKTALENQKVDSENLSKAKTGQDKQNVLTEIANRKSSRQKERENILIDIENTQKQIKIITAKGNDDLGQLEVQHQKRISDIAKDEETQRLEAFKAAEVAAKNVHEQQQGAIEADGATEKAALDKLLHDKVITQEAYDKLYKKSVTDNKILKLQSDLQLEESERNIAALQHKNLVEYDNSITKIKAEIKSAQSEPGDKTGDKGPSLDDSLKSTADSTKDIINSLVDEGYNRQITAIQKIIDLNNQRKEQEIAGINASSLSNQEKANQLIILDKTVAANNMKLARDQMAIKIKQAKFDRDSAILSILENAVIAEFKLPAQTGFAGIAAGIAIAAAAAAQITALLARPLPQMPAYAKGTDNHPGGPALFGEAGSERIDLPDGGSFIASKPTIGNLPRGSKVTPLSSDTINQAMYASMIVATANQVQAGERMLEAKNNTRALTEIKEAVNDGARLTAQAMRKQRGATTHIHIDGGWNAYITKNVKE